MSEQLEFAVRSMYDVALNVEAITHEALQLFIERSRKRPSKKFMQDYMDCESRFKPVPDELFAHEEIDGYRELSRIFCHVHRGTRCVSRMFDQWAALSIFPQTGETKYPTAFTPMRAQSDLTYLEEAIREYELALRSHKQFYGNNHWSRVCLNQNSRNLYQDIVHPLSDVIKKVEDIRDQITELYIASGILKPIKIEP